jgi:hypothetical protein
MAKRLVNLPEAVEPHHEQGKLCAVALPDKQSFLHAGPKQHPVGKIG